MKNISYEQSLEAAKPIKKIQDAAIELDVEYLTEVLAEMRKNHSMRDSAAVLNPSPFTHNQQQDLNAAKLEQLDLMLKLAKNITKIRELTINLHNASQNVDKLSGLFR